MSDPSTNIVWYGRPEPLPERRELRAGPLTALYENGDLRYVRFGDREVLRRVYVAVRDRIWATVSARLSNVRIEVEEETFSIAYDVLHRQDPVEFSWHGTIKGNADGTIRFEMDGMAGSTFLRNRIGFCVLHPMAECAGQPCRVEKTDGTQEAGAFPAHISPHQPFLNVRAVTHDVVPGLSARVEFEGDVFEMEDQRNWTDASFKTYSTPLALPSPVKVKEGTRIRQVVTLTIEAESEEVLRRDVPKDGRRGSSRHHERRSGTGSEPVLIEMGDAAVATFPRLGLQAASHQEPMSARAVARLKVLHLAHMRVDLCVDTSAGPSPCGPGEAAGSVWRVRLAHAVAEHKALGVPLEVGLYLSDSAEQEIVALRAALDELEPVVCRWLLFHRGDDAETVRWVRLLRERLGVYAESAQVGAGTGGFFTDLNRARPPFGVLDVVCYTMTPQVHAFDNASLAEAAAGQAETVRSARAFCGGCSLSVGPITLKRRFKRVGAAAPAPDQLPVQVDERQMSLFGAGWTLGSLKHMAESAAESVTYYETTGWLGVIETETGAPLPEKFRSVPGAVFPLYHVFADVAEFAGAEVIPCVSSKPLGVTALALRKEGAVRVMVANMTDHEQEIGVANVGEGGRVRRLDETNVGRAIRDPEQFRADAGEPVERVDGGLHLNVPPFGLATLDVSDHPPV